MESGRSKGRSLTPRWRSWILYATAGLILIGACGAFWLARKWPLTQAAITRSLEQRFERQVTMGRFRQTWFPPGCVASDVRFLHRTRKDLPPLITAREIAIDTSWTGLLRKHLTKVKIVGLHVTIPPADASGHSPISPVEGGKSQVLSVDEVIANDADLAFLPHGKGKARTLHVTYLRLDELKASSPVSFHLSLRSARPAGDVTSAGTLGPWDKDNPIQTPLSGQYKLVNTDLSAFHGLRGILAGEGKFAGNLSKVSADGSVKVPQFRVDDSAHSANLTVRYKALVNVETLDTDLEDVEARVGQTIVLAKGTVAGPEGQTGKTAKLDMTVNTGRVEDLLNYFSSEKKASMTGPVKLRAHVVLPPGPGFLKRLQLTGDFGVAGGKFTNLARQEPVNHLSESAAGEKKEQQEEDPRTVLANLNGHVVARNGVASLRNVSFEFPGATAEMSGTYNLIAKTVDIRGTLRTQGKLSDTSSGFKAVLLKVATPFLKKKKTTVAPFSITGSASNPAIGLRL